MGIRGYGWCWAPICAKVLLNVDKHNHMPLDTIKCSGYKDFNYLKTLKVIIVCQSADWLHYYATTKRERSVNLNMGAVLDTISLKIKIMTPKQFVAMKDSEKRNIERVKIVPPKFGRSDDFGSIEVELKDPIYEVKF